MIYDQKKHNLYEMVLNQHEVLTSNESNDDSDILENIRGNEKIVSHIAYLKSRASIQFIMP